jgi:hypothetical protein
MDGYLVAFFFLGTGPLRSIIFAMVASIASTAIIGKVFLEHYGSLDSSEPRALTGRNDNRGMVAVVFLIALSSFTLTGACFQAVPWFKFWRLSPADWRSWSQAT